MPVRGVSGDLRQSRSFLERHTAMRITFRRIALLSSAALLPVALSGTAVAATTPHHVVPGKPSVLSAAQVSKLSANATHRSIIVFKNQLPSMPATRADAQRRISAVATAQRGVRSQLAQVHATHVKSYQLINAISATVSSAEMT